jgi:CRISPR-associated protein Cas5d
MRRLECGSTDPNTDRRRATYGETPKVSIKNVSFDYLLSQKWNNFCGAEKCIEELTATDLRDIINTAKNAVGGAKMSYGVRLRVWGEYACFTRPEMKVERVSYDVMPPSAARGVLEAIHWKPAIRWTVDRIHVLKPIRFQSFRRNEVGVKMSVEKAKSAMRSGSLGDMGLPVEENRQQRAATLLVDVDYVIEAHFYMTDKAGPEDTPAKHVSMFNRRATSGQCFHRPCLGTREFTADFDLIAPDSPLPATALPEDQRDRDLGWMLYDIEFERDATSRFFRARLENGMLDVRRCLSEGTAS